VVGGNARLGARVRLMGSNTIGTAKDNGCPIIEDDVEIGCGARILGPVRIGARAQIAANAVVLQDVPADALAIGVPAVVRPARGAGVRAS
jgi:serine O-acetyltransferase